MKTNYLLAALILVFSCIGCEKETRQNHFSDMEELFPSDEEVTEYIRVRPSGTTANVFEGVLILDFPPGTVPTPTQYEIVSFPLDHLSLEGLNVMKRGISIKNITNDENKFAIPVTFLTRYDIYKYTDCQPDDKSDLTICRFYGDMYAFHKLEALGECCKDCSCKTLRTCITECGSYIVSVN